MSEKPQLQVPKFIKVKDIETARSGYNVYVKVVSTEKKIIDTRDGLKIPMVDCVLADETGSAKAFFKGENAQHIEKGNVVAIRNGVKRFIKDHISLEIDLFGRVTLQKDVTINASEAYDISSAEHKLEDKPHRNQGRNNRGGPRKDNNRGSRGGNDNRREGDNRRQGNNRREGDYRREPREPRQQREPRRDNREERPKREDREERPKREDRQERPKREERPKRQDKVERPNREDRIQKPRYDDRPRRNDNRNDTKAERPPRNDDRNDDRRNNNRDLDRRNDNRNGGEQRKPFNNDRRDNRRNNDRTYDKDYDRNNRNEGTGNSSRYQEKRQENRGERRAPMQWTSIKEITPGDFKLNLIVKVISVTPVGKNVRVVIGDGTGVSNAFFFDNKDIIQGESLAIFNARAEVVKEHIEIQLPRTGGRIDLARKPVSSVSQDFNLSEKAWVPID